MRIWNLQSLLICPIILWRVSSTKNDCIFDWLSRLTSQILILFLPLYFSRSWRRCRWICKNVSRYTMCVPNAWRPFFAARGRCWSRCWTSSARTQWSSSCWDSTISPNFRELLLSQAAWISCLLTSAWHSARICSFCLTSGVLIGALWLLSSAGRPALSPTGRPDFSDTDDDRPTSPFAGNDGHVFETYREACRRVWCHCTRHGNFYLENCLVSQGLFVRFDSSLFNVVGSKLVSSFWWSEVDEYGRKYK